MEIRFFETLPSTNRTAAEAAREGAVAFFTVWAKTQTAGRGRLDRSFHSPVGGTYFSTVLRPSLPRAQYTALTPFAALAVRRALSELTGVQADIKWVNDLYVNGKKICGILAEAGEDKEGAPFVILGIGINTGKDLLPPEIADIAANVPFDAPRALIERILTHLKGAEAAICEESWIAEYRAHCLWRGERVAVKTADAVCMARMLEVEPDGALFVEWENGARERLYGGEISLRSAQKGEI
ncbi:MAG: biotin--[Clostridia bacterium]|nr:biotin--[acetyl-CoA-carboxylase] ligase [Clostridia bacterium]